MLPSFLKNMLCRLNPAFTHSKWLWSLNGKEQFILFLLLQKWFHSFYFTATASAAFHKYVSVKADHQLCWSRLDPTDGWDNTYTYQLLTACKYWQLWTDLMLTHSWFHEVTIDHRYIYSSKLSTLASLCTCSRSRNSHEPIVLSSPVNLSVTAYSEMGRNVDAF